ncbi:hypothetical protein VNPA120719_40460 [Pseudomonas aeruginosa]|nr:hypothetical protein VNPA110516_41110 [Pseudomonas aeruginosa]GLE90653.1 hypothetical protein VNPA120719_40460 [Pseudomonas aeruginosa]
MAYAHAAEGAAGLAMVVAREPAQAHGIEHVEHGLTGRRRDGLAIEVDGHVCPREGLDIVLAFKKVHCPFIRERESGAGDTRSRAGRGH